jgi:hypothetical protein
MKPAPPEIFVNKNPILAQNSSPSSETKPRPRPSPNFLKNFKKKHTRPELLSLLRNQTKAESISSLYSEFHVPST